MKCAMQASSARLSAFVLIIGLLISSALVLSLVAGSSGRPVEAKKKDGKKTERQIEGLQSDEFDPQRDYDQSRASDEIRAYHGAIFFARVDSVEGEDKEPVADGIPPHSVLTYMVTVDRSLEGDVKSLVPIINFGAYEETYETAASALSALANDTYSLQVETRQKPSTTSRQEQERS